MPAAAGERSTHPPSTVLVKCGGQGHCSDGLSDAMHLHASQFLLFAFSHQVVELSSTVANQSPQVAHKFVDEPLALHLADHVSIVVIPK